MQQEVLKKAKEHMEAALSYLHDELAKLRGSRAQSSFVENVAVASYGRSYKLKELASIAIQQSNVIIIQPWDKTILDDIQKAISSSSLNLSSAVDGDRIRVQIPPLSEERRKELVRLLREKREEVRISIRGARDEVWEEIQTKEKQSEISEDEKFRAKEELQKLVDEYNKKVDELVEKKEKELMTV